MTSEATVERNEDILGATLGGDTDTINQESTWNESEVAMTRVVGKLEREASMCSHSAIGDRRRLGIYRGVVSGDAIVKSWRSKIRQPLPHRAGRVLLKTGRDIGSKLGRDSSR